MKMICLISCRIHSISLLYLTLVAANEKTCSPLNQLPVIQGSRLKGAVIETFTTAGILSCARECLLRTMCKSYNFQLDDGTCELSCEDGSASSLETAPGFVFSKSEDWPQGILGGCKDHSCPNNTVCKEADGGKVKCILAYTTVGSNCKRPIKCFERMTGGNREQLYNALYGLEDFDMQKSYLTGCIQIHPNADMYWIQLTTEMIILPARLEYPIGTPVLALYTIRTSLVWNGITLFTKINCRAPPTVKYVDSSVVRQFTRINHSLRCQVGFVPCGNMTCKPDGTWTTMTCLPVSNCSEVRQLSSTYTDGEYWLYPRQLDGVRVKVYCHAMNSTPSEYISLPTPYFMDAPSLQNYYCTGESPNDNPRLGYFVFSKFGLDIEKMEVKPRDHVFYNKTTTLDAIVGEVRDCYAKSDSACGRRGRAVMDLRGTGLALNETVTWKQYGGIPIVTRSSNDQLIEIRCGGWCGNCNTDGNALLTVFESDAPREDSAITPTCDV